MTDNTAMDPRLLPYTQATAYQLGLAAATFVQHLVQCANREDVLGGDSGGTRNDLTRLSTATHLRPMPLAMNEMSANLSAFPDKLPEARAPAVDDEEYLDSSDDCDASAPATSDEEEGGPLGAEPDGTASTASASAPGGATAVAVADAQYATRDVEELALPVQEREEELAMAAVLDILCPLLRTYASRFHRNSGRGRTAVLGTAAAAS